MSTALRERPAVNGHETPFDLAPSKTSARRRLPELAGGLLVVATFAIAALWWQVSTTDERSVLALRNPVERGQTLTADDLQVVGIGGDDLIATLDPAQAAQVVGRVARTDLAAGSVVTTDQFSDGSLIGDGDGVVGLSLEPGQFPSLALSGGDRVAVVLTPAPGDPAALASGFTAEVLVAEAIVVEVSTVGVQGNLFVAIQVSEADAARVAAASSANRVRLIQVAES
jgi:hypothetical protein